MASNESKTVVFITGANGGIGYETIKALVQSSRSYYIFLGSRSIEKGEEAAEALRTEFSNSTSEIKVIQIDVTSDDQINAAFDEVSKAKEYIDVLINNAGGFRDLLFYSAITNTNDTCRHLHREQNPPRRNYNTSSMERNVRRKCYWRTSSNSYICATPGQIERSAINLPRQRPRPARNLTKGTLPWPTATERMAKGFQDQSRRLQNKQNGVEHDYAHMALHFAQRWCQSVGCISGLARYESRELTGKIEAARRRRSIRGGQLYKTDSRRGEG